jgi:hypothetical protein
MSLLARLTLSIAAAGLTGPAIAQSLVALNREFQVNSQTINNQDQSAVGADADGKFIVVWRGNTEKLSQAIFAQRFDRFGAQVGGRERARSSDRRCW